MMIGMMMLLIRIMIYKWMTVQYLEDKQGDEGETNDYNISSTTNDYSDDVVATNSNNNTDDT